MAEKPKEKPADKDDRKSLHEAFLDVTENALNLASDNDLVKTIPFIGSALKVIQAVKDYRSRIFARKLLEFVSAPELQTPDAKKAIEDKIQASPESADEVGELLFLILDKVVDVRKPRLLAKVYLAYSQGTIKLEELRRLAGAIDAAFVDDIQRLRCGDRSNAVLERLVPAGLARIDHSALLGGFDSLDFKPSSYGTLLARVLGPVESDTP